MQRIFDACHKADVPEPILDCSRGDIWIEFPFSRDYLNGLAASVETTSLSQAVSERGEKEGEKEGETLSMNRQFIVDAMRKDPVVTHVQLAERIGITRANIDRNIRFLKMNGWVRRVGPAKGGHWEVLK